jgi:hypothetical protein
VNNTEENQNVDLRKFADMAGFPIELVKKELFESNEESEESISLDKLRQAMINYLNKNMLED